jgi:phage shock protein PspC (stress-responsive transcriptional regulator)
MNKTTTVNISGMAFYLDEAAYSKLSKYLESIKAHFAGKSYGQEVITDIEGRIAEQFMAKTQGNDQKVITEKDIDVLIARLGKIEDFAEGEGEQVASAKPAGQSRRLYRNPDDVMIGGVASGLAAYLGTEATFIRILFLITVFLGGYGILLYLILWMVVPEASTPTEKLEMRGSPVTLAHLEQSIKNNISKAGANEKLQKTGSSIGHFIRQLVQLFIRIIKFFFSAVLAIGGTIVSFAASMAAFALTVALVVLLVNPNSKYIDYPIGQVFSGTMYSIFTTSAFLAVFIPLIFISLIGIALARKRIAFNKIAILSMVGIWVVAVSALASVSVKHADKIEAAVNAPAADSITRTFDVRDFDKIEAHGTNRINLIQGENFSVSATGPEDDINELKLTNENGSLLAYREDRFRICIFCRQHEVTIDVTMPDLSFVDASGASRVTSSDFVVDNFTLEASGASRADIKLSANQIKIDLSGASTADLIGQANGMNFKISGASRLNADQFTTSIAEGRTSGASKAFLWVNDELHVTASGASKVRYKGQPRTTFDESGSSDIEPEEIDFE